MKKCVFEGSCTAVVTPFSASGIDYPLLRAQIDYQANGGTQAIVVAGTTGENPTLEQAEFELLTERSIEFAAKRMKVIVGIGGNNTLHCLDKARFAAHSGADAVLMSTPYYNKTTQRGLLRHFLTVADGAEIPLILYNVPSRTGIGISAETYRCLSEHPNINGTKEASGDFSLIARIMSECGDALHIWSGNDDQTIPIMALGGKGVISVASNIVPHAIASLCDRCFRGDFAAARRIHAANSELFRLLFIETNPIPIKAAMQLCGLDSGQLRLPLVEISDENKQKLLLALKNAGLLPC